MQGFEKNTKSSVETEVQSGTGHTPPLSYSSSFSNFSVRLSIGALKRQQKLEKYKLPRGNEPVSLSPFPVFVVFWAWGLTSTTTINVVDYQSSTPLPLPQLHRLSSWPPHGTLHSPQIFFATWNQQSLSTLSTHPREKNCQQSRIYAASAIHTLGNYM